MYLKHFVLENDFEIIKNWINDERTHAMWCANHFSFPLEKENFSSVLSYVADKFGDTPYLAMTGEESAAGFFCYSLNEETKEGMLKFVVINPELRGKGAAGEMLKAICGHAFENGAQLVQLNVFPENIRAKKCYLKAGFITRSITENAFSYKDESWGRCNMILRK